MGNLKWQLSIRSGQIAEDSSDYGSVVYQYDDGVVWTHLIQHLKNYINNGTVYNLGADFMGTVATAHLAYWGKVSVRGGPKHYSGNISRSIYDDGAKANVAEFYRCVTQKDFSNPTIKRSVDGTITAILGREAMARKCYLTRDEVIRENKKFEVNLKGLKA